MEFRKVIIGSIVAVLIGTLLVPAAGATSSFHFSADTLAVTKKRSTGTSIWKADIYGHKVDTGNLHLGTDVHSPVWSPNGRQLAYIKNGQLFVADKNEYNRQVSYGVKGYQDASPAWSPDGSKIALARTSVTSGRQAVYVIKLHGNKATNISGWSNGNYRSPSWSPDNDKLVYEQYSDTAARLLIKTLKTGEQTVLTDLSEVTASSEVSWSPAGKKILYKDSSNETYTIWPDGSHRAVISDGDSYQASWSPSGDRMVFLEDPGDASLSISEKDGTVVWLPIQMGEYDELAHPTWSPDEDKVAFTMIKDNASERRSDLFMIDLKSDSAQPRLLVKNNTGQASWR